jgi:hypothetical protein
VVLHLPSKTCAELGPILTIPPLVHLVPLLRGGTIRAKLRAFAGFVPPSRPRLSIENVVRPLIYALRTPRLAELQGHLVPLCRERSLSKSGASCDVFHGRRRSLHMEIRPVVIALAKAQE